MNLAKTIRIAFAFALLLAGNLARAEEEHSILTPLSETTLSGYVDTSASWWIGALGIPNDFARNAIGADATVSIPTNLTNSTLETGEPAQPNQTGSVWYKWTATQSGVARISTKTNTPVTPVDAHSFAPALSEESIFYPDGDITYGGGTESGYEEWVIITHPNGYQRWWSRLAVYHAIQLSETAATLEFIARGESLEFAVQAGEQYWVAVEIYQRAPAYEGQPELPSSLPTNLFLDLTPPPSNDAFSSILSIADSCAASLSGYTLAATREAGEPDLGGAFATASVWFHYTAATYGTVTIGTETTWSARNTAPLAVFTGTELSNLKLVAKADGGALSFFGEEGKIYHVAVYHSEAAATGFWLGLIAPRYRLYETTLDALFPNGLTPQFHGVRGVTMLLYAKQTTGWQLVEVEPIVDRATDLLIRPNAPLDGQLRVLTIDEALPSPHVEFARDGDSVSATLVGIPSQTCAISYSTDLLNWSEPQILTLETARTFLRTHDQQNTTYFYRVTQSRPLAPIVYNPIGVIVQTQPVAGNVPPPPVP